MCPDLRDISDRNSLNRLDERIILLPNPLSQDNIAGIIQLIMGDLNNVSTPTRELTDDSSQQSSFVVDNAYSPYGAKAVKEIYPEACGDSFRLADSFPGCGGRGGCYHSLM